MRGTTKTFIETNINLIENKDWSTLYQGWYDIAYGEIDTDQVRIDDLNTTLYEAGVCTEEETLETRKQIIRKEVETIIQDWIDNIDSWKGSPYWIGIYYVTYECLRSHLDLTNNTVEEIVRDVAINKGLVPDRLQTGFTLRR